MIHAVKKGTLDNLWIAFTNTGLLAYCIKPERSNRAIGKTDSSYVKIEAMPSVDLYQQLEASVTATEDQTCTLFCPHSMILLSIVSVCSFILYV